ncbi:unnamed protein product [Phytophthora fragariaefolia]|uniref:Unnamed protein product n=1 Tax=Phytophthora fragariaefolia TaxID=1490495 RepID=A0A9W6Y8Z8_9STRA|nr:unnamed protein product [Phytophthora fragariaefolia]
MSIHYVGPMETVSHHGFTGMVSIVMEPFHLTAVFPVKDKSSTTQLHAIRNCIGMLKAASPGTRVCVLKSTNAAEYTAEAIAEFCNEQMISQELSTPSDGCVSAEPLPNQGTKGKTPIKALIGSPPALSQLRAFGCEVQVLMPAATRRKLDAKTRTGVLLGYGAGSQFRFWITSGVGSSVRVVISRDTVFYEDKPKGAVELDLSDTDLQGPVHTSEPVGVTEPVEETATGLPDEADVDMSSPTLPAVCRLEFEESHAAAEEAVAFANDEDPTTLEEAMAHPDAEAWRQAIEKELKSTRHTKKLSRQLM